MKVGSRALLAPFENGGGFGIRGKNGGQDIDVTKIIQHFRGGMEEQVRGVLALRKNPLLLGYVASFHENVTVRSLAMSFLNDPRVLCIVARSGNQVDSVIEAFQKLDGKLEIIDSIDRHLVAVCAPSKEMRYEALSLLRDNFSRIFLDQRRRYYHNLVSDIDWDDACGVHEVIMDVEGLEKSILSGAPITEEQITRRRGEFDPENLSVLLSRG